LGETKEWAETQKGGKAEKKTRRDFWEGGKKKKGDQHQEQTKKKSDGENEKRFPACLVAGHQGEETIVQKGKWKGGAGSDRNCSGVRVQKVGGKNRSGTNGI